MVPSGTFKGLSIFLAWLNLDFGIETCFYNGMNQYSKTWLQFVFPAYLLVLVLLIILICKFSISASHFFAMFGDPVGVLATVILLSYTKIVRTILEALSFASIDFSSNSPSALVWLFDGNVDFAQGYHIILVIFALVVLVLFVLPYTTILTGIQYVTESCCVSNRLVYKKLYEFFKRYHPAYKSKHRYWPGLFLIVRLILLITFAVNFLGNPSTNLLAISTVCICTGSYSWIVGGVYELKLLENNIGKRRYVEFIDKWLLDAIESLFVMNLGIFTAVTYHIKVTSNSVMDQAVVANISLGFVFVQFLLVVSIHVCIRIARIVEYWQKNLTTGGALEDQDENNKHLLTVSADYGALEQNIAHPTIQEFSAPVKRKRADYSQLRETLVEDM